MQEHITKSREEREALVSEKHRLENDMKYIEKLAREKYRMAKPGEKLYEELQSFDEKMISTSHKKIMALKDQNHKVIWEELKSKILDLINVSEELDSDKIQSNWNHHRNHENYSSWE